MNREERSLLLEEMWAEERRNSCGLCVMCPTCGGGSTSFCRCAKKRWRQEITDQEINEFRQKKLERQEKELIRQEEQLKKKREKLAAEKNLPGVKHYESIMKAL